MRITVACLLVATLERGASADAKIKELIRGYEKEAGSCQKNTRGVRVVIERGRPVAGNDRELADDLDGLAKAQATVQGYCDELEATLELLKADPSATYKQRQKEIDERDKRIRAGRIASRQALADADQRISRSVPRINKLIAVADAAARPSTREQQVATEKAAAEKAAADKAAEKTPPKVDATTVTAPSPVAVKPLSRFPSGRAIELPGPAEAWTLSGTADADIADYAFAGAKATLFVRSHAGAPTCDQIRTSMALVGGRAPAQASDAGPELKSLKPAWAVAWSEGDSQVRVVCVKGKAGVVVGRADASLIGNAPLGTALARMIAANLTR
jgi:hypothetical protein